MMKMLLRFTVLLAFSAHFVSTATIISKRGTSQKEIEEGLKKINEARATYAKQHTIGNMHEVVYDSGLEKKAQDMSNCNFGAGDYFFFFPDKMDNSEIEKMLFHPLQTSVGCSSLPAECPNRNLDKDTEYCLIGPNSDFSSKDVKTGPPGSHCSGAKTDSGLCKAGGSGGSGGNSEGTGGSESKGTGSINVFFSISSILLALMCAQF